MNFLALVNRLKDESGNKTSDLTTTVGLTGEGRLLVNWVNNSWADIQQLHNDWLWMTAPFTVNTVANTDTYTSADCGISNFRTWKKNTITCYLQSTGVSDESEIFYEEYDEWRRFYKIGTQSPSKPLVFTIQNDLSLGFGPKPNAVYVVNGEYHKSASDLTADTGIPALPLEYHLLIVWWALTKYAYQKAAPEVLSWAEAERKRMIRSLERTQLPRKKWANPLC